MIDTNTLLVARPLIEGHEGRRNRMYKCSAGFNTVGIGHNLDALPISNEAVNVIFSDDLAMVETDLDKHLPWWRGQDPIRAAALLDLCFNMGINSLLGFRNTLSAWSRGDYALAANGLIASKWFGQVGRRGPRIVGMVKDGVAP